MKNFMLCPMALTKLRACLGLFEVSTPGSATSKTRNRWSPSRLVSACKFLRLPGAVLADHAVELGATKLGTTHSSDNPLLRHHNDKMVSLEPLASLVRMNICRCRSHLSPFGLPLHAKVSKLSSRPSLVLVSMRGRAASQSGHFQSAPDSSSSDSY